MIVFREAADHTRRAAVWCSLKQSVMMQLTYDQHACELVFEPKMDILNILCDYQFVFSVLDELCVSHHASRSRCCSKCALEKYEM